MDDSISIPTLGQQYRSMLRSEAIPTWDDLKQQSDYVYEDPNTVDLRSIPLLRTQYLAWLTTQAAKRAYGHRHELIEEERGRWDHRRLMGVTSDMMDYVTALKQTSHPRGDLAENELTGHGAVLFESPIGVAPPEKTVRGGSAIVVAVTLHAAAWSPGPIPGTVFVCWYALPGDDAGFRFMGLTIHDRGTSDANDSGRAHGLPDLVRYSQYLRTIMVMRDQARAVESRRASPARVAKSARQAVRKRLGSAAAGLLRDGVQVLTVHTLHEGQRRARVEVGDREGQKLAYRVEVDPYIRRTHFGPGKSWCEQRWVKGHVRGPEGAPLLVRERVEVIDR